MNRKWRFALAAAILVGAVVYLMYTGVSQTATYYLTVEEFEARRPTLEGEGVRVAGRVAPGSVQRRLTPQGDELRFFLGDFTTDGSATKLKLAVHYVGVVPDMFKEEGGSDVIVEGRFEGGVLRAHSVLTSCPSKYEPMEEHGQAPEN